jgi:hypothetical protein
MIRHEKDQNALLHAGYHMGNEIDPLQTQGLELAAKEDDNAMPENILCENDSAVSHHCHHPT